jgi:tail fiber protein gp32
MADTTITSANSVFSLVVPGLFPAPVQLSGYSTERAWNSDGQDLAETQMGVDGRMAFGYVPAPVRMTISLQADSPSKAIFTAIARAVKAAKDQFTLSAVIVLPGTGESFTLSRGVLQNAKAIADAAKVLQAMDFVIVWQDVASTLI